MTQEQHFDVAAYALGVLDAHDAARFEDHLIDCPTCALELESMLPVVDLLSELDADSIVATEQSRNDGVVLHRMIGEVAKERRRANSRRLYSLAAAVLVFAVLSVGALFAGGRWLPGQGTQGPNGGTQALPTQSAANSDTLDPLPPRTDQGGPDLVGELRGGDDKRTGVRLDYGLETKAWGTQISFKLSNVKGPLTCSLVAQRTSGEKVTLTTWTVGPNGWGTAKQPNPLMLQAVTALPASDIAHLLVEGIGEDGKKVQLVSV